MGISAAILYHRSGISFSLRMILRCSGMCFRLVENGFGSRFETGFRTRRVRIACVSKGGRKFRRLLAFATKISRRSPGDSDGASAETGVWIQIVAPTGAKAHVTSASAFAFRLIVLVWTGRRRSDFESIVDGEMLSAVRTGFVVFGEPALFATTAPNPRLLS